MPCARPPRDGNERHADRRPVLTNRLVTVQPKTEKPSSRPCSILPGQGQLDRLGARITMPHATSRKRIFERPVLGTGLLALPAALFVVWLKRAPDASGTWAKRPYPRTMAMVVLNGAKGWAISAASSPGPVYLSLA